MSQIYKSAASGPSPPQDVQMLRVDDVDPLITTILQTDPQNISATANVIQLNGSNGIVTYQVPNVAGQTNIAQIGFIRATGQTVGAASLDMITVNTDPNECFTMQVLISAYSDNDLGVGGYTTATAINIAGVLSLVDEPDIIFQNPDLPATNFEIVPSGTDLIVRVTGSAGRTIQWNAIIPGISIVAKP